MPRSLSLVHSHPAVGNAGDIEGLEDDGLPLAEQPASLKQRAVLLRAQRLARRWNTRHRVAGRA